MTDVQAEVQSCEVSWFSALCDDDYEFLGVADPALRSSWEHCRDIALAAESGGFDNLLLPSNYPTGFDNTVFAAAIAPFLRRMRLLLAVRSGELGVPQLARQLAALDQVLEGRLTLNIISSSPAGEHLESEQRYARTLEQLQLLRRLLDGEAVSFHGEHFDLDVPAPTLLPTQKHVPFYFGGLSESAREVAAQCADVYLFWPDRIENLASTIDDLRGRAARYGRSLRFGLRIHAVVRASEAEAQAAADRLISRLAPEVGEQLRQQSLHPGSVGNARQEQTRTEADAHGYLEPHVWTGVGRARAGCGAALVGDPDQVIEKIHAYQEIGLEAFVLSGYPHNAEGDLFARHVLPFLDHGPLQVEPEPLVAAA